MRHRCDRPGLERALLERLEGVDRAGLSVDHLRADPASVGLELPRTSIVGQHQVDDLGDPGASFGILDRDHSLDAAVEVAIHKVRRADVPLAVAPIGEAPDPRVLEELADDRSDTYSLRDARQPRLQRASSTHDEVHLDARTRSPIEHFDDRHVDDGIELEHDMGRPTRRSMGDLALDEVDETLAEVVWRDEQSPEGPLPRKTGEDVEQVGDIGADLGPCGEEAQVHVQARRLRVVVPRPDMDVAAQTRSLATHDERRLAVGLEPDESVDDMRARSLELA